MNVTNAVTRLREQLVDLNRKVETLQPSEARRVYDQAADKLRRDTTKRDLETLRLSVRALAQEFDKRFRKIEKRQAHLFLRYERLIAQTRPSLWRRLFSWRH